jgi:hypothetical protein
MDNRKSMIAAAVALFVLGLLLGALGTTRAFTSGREATMYRPFESALLRVANPDGAPKSPETIVRSARHVLAMETVNTGKMYPAFRNKDIRDALVAAFKRIDANRAALQLDNAGEWEAEADRVRACVIKFAKDNKGATECLNACSRINYEIGDAQTGKISRSVPCKP